MGRVLSQWPLLWADHPDARYPPQTKIFVSNKQAPKPGRLAWGVPSQQQQQHAPGLGWLHAAPAVRPNQNGLSRLARVTPPRSAGANRMTLSRGGRRGGRRLEPANRLSSRALPPPPATRLPPRPPVSPPPPPHDDGARPRQVSARARGHRQNQTKGRGGAKLTAPGGRRRLPIIVHRFVSFFPRQFPCLFYSSSDRSTSSLQIITGPAE